jgi:hypothetical protein
MSRFFPLVLVLLALLTMAGCAQIGVEPAPTSPAAAACPAPAACPACPVCPVVEPPKPPEKPLQSAEWNELPGWNEDDPGAAFAAFLSRLPQPGKAGALEAGLQFGARSSTTNPPPPSALGSRRTLHSPGRWSTRTVHATD